MGKPSRNRRGPTAWPHNRGTDQVYATTQRESVSSRAQRDLENSHSLPRSGEPITLDSFIKAERDEILSVKKTWCPLRVSAPSTIIARIQNPQQRTSPAPCS